MVDGGLDTQKSQPKLKTRAAKGDARKARAQARPGLRRFLIWSVRSGKLFALIVLVIAVWLLYAAFTSPQYVVRTVAARGNTALTTEDVQTLAGVEGQSIWFVRDADVEERVRQSPYVQQVRAQVVLPDQVIVNVTERRPEVSWTHGGTAYAVTWEGLVLASAAENTEAAAPATEPVSATDALSATDGISNTQAAAAGSAFVSAVSIVDTTPNRTLKPGDYVDADALEVARRVTLRSSELPTTIQRIEWDAGLGVSLIISDNRQVVIGKSDRLDEKLAVTAQLLHESAPFSYLDLRTTTPYYR